LPDQSGQFVGHRVEAVGQLAELVSPATNGATAQVALAHLVHH